MSRDDDGSRSTADGALEEAWRTERPVLVKVATGIVSDPSVAEDVVQEAFDRLSRQDVDGIDNVGAWLTVVVRRLAINHVKSASSRRELVSDPEHAESNGIGVGADEVDPADRITLDDQVQLALSVMLSSLSPGERTAFVLHDVFGFSFTEIGEIVGRTPQACRQLASRARRSLRSVDPESAIDVDPAIGSEVTERFIAACSTGDLDALLTTLDPDVVGDGKFLGGKPAGHAEGPDQVARLALVHFGPESRRTLLPISVDGTPGVLGVGPDKPSVVLRIDESDGRIWRIHSYISLRNAWWAPG